MPGLPPSCILNLGLANCAGCQLCLAIQEKHMFCLNWHVGGLVKSKFLTGFIGYLSLNFRGFLFVLRGNWRDLRPLNPSGLCLQGLGLKAAFY